MKRLIFMFSLLGWSALLIHPPCWASRAYVTDVFEITLRTGPSLDNKIIAMLPSGTAMEIANTQGDWSLVRVPESGKEGWVLSRYLITRLPWSVQVKSLRDENTALQTKLTQVEAGLGEAQLQKKELAAELQKKSKRLDETQASYETLKQGAEGFLRLKRTNAMNEAALAAAKTDLDKLRGEVEELRSSQMTRWFATGALVLLCGLLVGIMVGRQQKKRKPFYS